MLYIHTRNPKISSTSLEINLYTCMYFISYDNISCTKYITYYIVERIDLNINILVLYRFSDIFYKLNTTSLQTCISPVEGIIFYTYMSYLILLNSICTACLIIILFQLVKKNISTTEINNYNSKWTDESQCNIPLHNIVV